MAARRTKAEQTARRVAFDGVVEALIAARAHLSALPLREGDAQAWTLLTAAIAHLSSSPPSGALDPFFPSGEPSILDAFDGMVKAPKAILAETNASLVDELVARAKRTGEWTLSATAIAHIFSQPRSMIAEINRRLRLHCVAPKQGRVRSNRYTTRQLLDWLDPGGPKKQPKRRSSSQIKR